MRLLTAMELFTHPEDLFLMVFQPKGQDKWGVQIARGQGHDYKLLLSNGLDEPAHWNTRQEAVDAICETLVTVIQVASEELQNASSLVAAVANPEGLPEHQMWNCLKPEDVGEIKERFIETNAVDTSKVPLNRLSESTAS